MTDRPILNPKDAAATRDRKPRLDLLEHCAEVQIAEAMHTGAVKYGVANYRDVPIQARVYGAAIRRHVGAWLEGEDLDPESGLSHLAHIGANVHVLLGAMEAGAFQDDRGPAERTEEQEVQSSASNEPVWITLSVPCGGRCTPEGCTARHCWVDGDLYE